MPRPIDNLESAFTEMYEFITDLPSGLDGFESDFDEAFKELENLKVAIAQPGKPLTLDQLREMDGQPVWVVCLKKEKYIDPPIGWRILEKSISGSFGVWNGENCLSQRSYSSDWFAYSYPPAHIDRSKWISVKNDKPSDLQEVNVTFVNHCPEPYYSSVKDKPFTGTCVYYKEDWFWYSSITRDVLAEYGRYDSEKVDPDIEITHWMPLPEPPEEG